MGNKSAAQPDKAYLTARETAAHAGVSPEHVCQEIEAGRIEAMRVGRTYAIALAEAERFRLVVLAREQTAAELALARAQERVEAARRRAHRARRAADPK